MVVMCGGLNMTAVVTSSPAGVGTLPKLMFGVTKMGTAASAFKSASVVVSGSVAVHPPNDNPSGSLLALTTSGTIPRNTVSHMGTTGEPGDELECGVAGTSPPMVGFVAMTTTSGALGSVNTLAGITAGLTSLSATGTASGNSPLPTKNSSALGMNLVTVATGP